MDQYNPSCLNDKPYHIPTDELEGFPPQPQVIKMFKKGCSSYNDFLNLLSSRRNASGPGFNGIPYKVYKTCSKFQILKCAFSKGEISVQLWSAREIYVSKSKVPSGNSISDFQPIALPNVEGKVFFSLISKRLELED